VTEDVLMKQISGINMETVPLVPDRIQVHREMVNHIVLDVKNGTLLINGPINQNPRKRNRLCNQKNTGAITVNMQANHLKCQMVLTYIVNTLTLMLLVNRDGLH
jgi:hypothetical protein